MSDILPPETHRSAPRQNPLSKVFSSVLLTLVWTYRRVISPPLHLLLGPRFGCRFYPTCSDYAAEAIRLHGPACGGWLAVCRLARCTPLHPGGVDFVPPRGALRPRCVRTA